MIQSSYTDESINQTEIGYSLLGNYQTQRNHYFGFSLQGSQYAGDAASFEESSTLGFNYAFYNDVGLIGLSTGNTRYKLLPEAEPIRRFREFPLSQQERRAMLLSSVLNGNALELGSIDEQFGSINVEIFFEWGSLGISRSYSTAQELSVPLLPPRIVNFLGVQEAQFEIAEQVGWTNENFLGDHDGSSFYANYNLSDELSLSASVNGMDYSGQWSTGFYYSFAEFKELGLSVDFGVNNDESWSGAGISWGF